MSASVHSIRSSCWFFVFHFIFPFLLCAFLLFQIFNLHFLSSNNPLRNSTIHKIAFFLSLSVMERYEFSIYIFFKLISASLLSHIEACGLHTPLHIEPEWYFLCQYAMLKAVPDKNAGFIILFTSIFILF